MLFRNLGSENGEPGQRLQWEDLNFGAPTIIAFATLCGRALTEENPNTETLDQDLSPEAKTILVAAVNRGTIDIRASREPVDSAQRFLAVCVEFALEQRLLFLDRGNPEQTMRFLEGFRQLCASGLVMHHLQKDFSLSASGFEYARSLNNNDFEGLLGFATETEH